MAQNKLRKFLITSLTLLATITAISQTPTKYWVKFKDKVGSPYSISNPSAFLSAKSILRRTNQNISLDISDIPVNQSYIDMVNATGAIVFQRSKWFNAAIVLVTNPTQLTAINNLTCVLSSALVGRHTKKDKIIETTYPVSFSNKLTQRITSYNYGPSITQSSQIGVDCMHDLGFRGQNMTIAVIDAGFLQANINPVFDSLRNEGRILGTRDYVEGNTSVYEDDSHGAIVLSLIAGNSPGNLIGTGPKAQFWLLRTEAPAEKIIEEANWVVAVEFADSVGVDIATTSLGYTTFDNAADNHVYADLNGRTAIASIGATMASRKGIFVLNAAGNEGDKPWLNISVPSDADSICTVGSVNGGGVHSSFSGIGPTSDGRIKPDLSTMGEGTYVCQPSGNFTGGSGTSYATPVLAGAVACLWQAHPKKTNMEILKALKATASHSITADNNYGWGIPNICEAHHLLLDVSIEEKNDNQFIKLYPNPVNNILNFKLTKTPESISIMDVLGKQISFTINNTAANLYTLNLSSDIVKGVYFVSIKTNLGIYYSKFIKE